MKLYQSLIDRLKNQHEAIEQVIHAVLPAELMLKPGPGKWSIHDNIAHLARYQSFFINRVNTILTSDVPFFERYVAENDSDFSEWQQRDTGAVMKTLYVDRDTIFNLITILSESQLNRTGHHAAFGKLTITEWTEFFLLHEAHHIYTIFRLANTIAKYTSENTETQV